MAGQNSKPERWDCTNAEYHADTTHESSSTLTEFLDNRWLYYRRRVIGEVPPREQTEAMLLGSVVDAMLSKTFADEYAVLPSDCMGASKRAVELRGQFEAEANAEGKSVIRPGVYEKGFAMADAARSDRYARPLLDRAGECQASYRWSEPETGIGLKVRFDRRLDDGNVVEFKTLARPTLDQRCDLPFAWAKVMAQRAYHRQAALYWMAARLIAEFPVEHWSIVILKDAPHEVCVFQTGPRTLEAGWMQTMAILRALADCRERDRTEASDDHWRGPKGRAPQTVEIPPWELNRKLVL